MPAESTASQSYNFSRAGLVPVEQMRSLRGVDEQFARNLTHTLGAWLRTTVSVVPQAAEQRVFSQFMEKTASGNFATLLRLEPMGARGVMALGLEIAPAVIDMLLGGSGRVNALERELTEIESAVLESVLEIVLREWNAAWMAFEMQFTPEARERDAHSKRWMPLQERVFECRFAVTLGDATGELLFCMPTSAVQTALRGYAQRRERQRRRAPAESGRMLQRLDAAKVHAVLHFPAMRLRTEELRTMAPGRVLHLPLQQGCMAEIRVSGVAIFRAQPVKRGEHRGAAIVDAIEKRVAGEIAE